MRGRKRPRRSMRELSLGHAFVRRSYVARELRRSTRQGQERPEQARLRAGRPTHPRRRAPDAAAAERAPLRPRYGDDRQLGGQERAGAAARRGVQEPRIRWRRDLGPELQTRPQRAPSVALVDAAGPVGRVRLLRSGRPRSCQSTGDRVCTAHRQPEDRPSRPIVRVGGRSTDHARALPARSGGSQARLWMGARRRPVRAAFGGGIQDGRRTTSCRSTTRTRRR